ncbi:MAG: hypothetical protein ACOC97_04335 [Myxococcota bacterium]
MEERRHFRRPSGAGRVLEAVRSHRARDREWVETDAGRFDAWRFTYRERIPLGVGRPALEVNGQWWVAEGVGLVRARYHRGGELVEHVLAEFRSPSAP